MEAGNKSKEGGSDEHENYLQRNTQEIELEKECLIRQSKWHAAEESDMEP